MMKPRTRDHDLIRSRERRRPVAGPDSRRRGVVAILAMMFLVIFGSLAAAMAIVAQGNLTTADTHLKVNRSLAAAETGLNYLIVQINQIAATVKTRAGQIDQDNAPDLWQAVRDGLLAAMLDQPHNMEEPYIAGGILHIGPIDVGPGAPRFTATLQPHPITSENYDAAYYQRPPYAQLSPPVSNSTPLGPTWIRVRVVAADGPPQTAITRSIQVDFRLEKKIPFAILSKSRVMIGRHVMVDGPVASRFIETNLPNGHPVQMVSDFAGLNSQLDDNLELLAQSLHLRDQDGDNRLNLDNPSEIAGLTDPQLLDLSGDGYINDFDFFLDHYDADRDGRITATELDTTHHIEAAQLLALIDTMGNAGRGGYGDGVIDEQDRYAKVRGQVYVSSTFDTWNEGAAGGMVQNYFRGPIHPPQGRPPVTFSAPDLDVYEFGPADFDVTTFKTAASGSLASQAATQAARHDPDNPGSPGALGQTSFESVPYGAAHPYDYYNRPVYENMTFQNVTIPRGTNALFRNCTFIGVTFVETSTHNDDANFNCADMSQADGSLKHPDLTATVNGVAVANTKTLANNIRFDGCTFEGSLVSDAPPAFTHVRNKITFTGTTRFPIDQSINLSDDEKQLYKRSTILMPHYSVEMGTFTEPANPSETVELSGTIVAGVLDIRGKVKVTGTILTTFEPRSNEGPVVGETSPQFNTTLGYFASSDGDLEAELPGSGMGIIQIRYDPALALPDGILGPVQLVPVMATYFEGGS